MDRTLRLGIYGHGVPFSGKSLETGSLGGSETMYVQMAEALARRGHSVTVLTLGGEEGSFNGVDYLDYTTRRDYALGCLEYDVFLVGRDYARLTMNIRTKMLGLWCHDILTDPVGFQESVYATDFVFCLSQYHQSLYAKGAQAASPLLCLTRNGVDLSLIDAQKLDKKFPATFVYGSRPERGLIYLLQHIWPRVLERLPDAKLYLAGYEVEQERLPEHVKRVHRACQRLLDKSQSVFNLGHLKKSDWYKVLWSAQVMLYPTDFPEISCLSAIEAQACEVSVVTTNDFALPECVQNPYSLISGHPNDHDYVEHFVERAVSLSENFHLESARKRRQSDRVAIVQQYNIDMLAADWEAFFWDQFIMRASTDSAKIVKRLIYNSDLLAAKHVIETVLTTGNRDQIAQQYKAITELLDVQHLDPDLYSVYVDTPETQLEGVPSRMQRAIDFIRGYSETRNQTETHPPPRPQRSRPAINDHLLEQMEADKNPFLTTETPKRLRLLDIGCGGGRFLHGVVKQLGDQIEPYGIDFSKQMVITAHDFLMSMHMPEAAAHIVHADLPNYDWGFPFDVIFIGEWLEHQQDLYGMLEKIFSLLVPGGLAVFTVPSGPWESLSFGSAFAKDGREVRFHVSHFELRDLLDLFRNKPHQLVFDPFQVSPADGALLGNWVIAVHNEGGPLGKIDYERKFLTTRPYETIAATIISKNEEADILRMVKSVEQHVDEIIIYDTGSTDKTRAMVEDRPKVKCIQGHWENDFSTARNAAVSWVAPDTDWIFWCDCDEVLINGARLRKYAQGRLYEGYVILQHHLILDAEQSPDVPVRLYRHKRGYAFSGKIHEHVQVSLNEPIAPLLVLPDVHIAHFGYLTESERRSKVQGRNLDMLIADRKENPGRHLGSILLMRDLVNIILWNQEARQSESLDENDIHRLWEILRLYEPFMDPGHLYHDVGFEHYQKALQMLGSRGFVTEQGLLPFAVCFKMDFNLETPPSIVWFQTSDELEQWVRHRVTKLRV